ncbi:MAG: hypothetical protein K0S37_4029 [Microbacterium sp.]|jgi:hypothetical protein|nr:hypothetical protein [Microbacterium sp.]
MRPTVLAYFFPDWQTDPRNDAWFGDGWTEWELVRQATPRFPGHRQPRVPALGELDDSDPEAMARQTELAYRSGVDGFVFDFYWYDDGPYLNRALDDGLLPADTPDDFRFGIMWANHELVDIFPSRHHRDRPEVLKAGRIDRGAFEAMATHVIDRYFSDERYLRIDGKPFFSVYEVGSLIEGLGGVRGARAALDWFREATVAAGHPGLHLDMVVWGFGVLPTAVTVQEPGQLIRALGADSATSYVWIHHTSVAHHPWPLGDWGDVERDAFEEYERYADTLPVPFHPNVSVGWDPSPRTDQSQPWRDGTYPWMTVWDATPEDFRRGLLRARSFLDAHPVASPLLTINAWNEWTEGSALLPDETHGERFLEQIREVFPR